MCPQIVTALASFRYKPLPHLQTTWLVLVLSNFRLCFWGVNFPFSLPIDLTSETCVVSRATLCAGTALQQPASCLADAQGQLTGDNQVLSGKMQGAWQSPVRSLLGSRCSHQVEENNIQAQNCMIFFSVHKTSCIQFNAKICRQKISITEYFPSKNSFFCQFCSFFSHRHLAFGLLQH